MNYSESGSVLQVIGLIFVLLKDLEHSIDILLWTMIQCLLVSCLTVRLCFI